MRACARCARCVPCVREPKRFVATVARAEQQCEGWLGCLFRVRWCWAQTMEVVDGVWGVLKTHSNEPASPILLTPSVRKQSLEKLALPPRELLWPSVLTSKIPG